MTEDKNVSLKACHSTVTPGSYEAILKGCSCPMLTNNFGERVAVGGKIENALFWINKNCPVHGERVK